MEGAGYSTRMPYQAKQAGSLTSMTDALIIQAGRHKNTDKKSCRDCVPLRGTEPETGN